MKKLVVVLIFLALLSIGIAAVIQQQTFFSNGVNNVSIKLDSSIFSRVTIPTPNYALIHNVTINISSPNSLSVPSISTNASYMDYEFENNFNDSSGNNHKFLEIGAGTSFNNSPGQSADTSSFFLNAVSPTGKLKFKEWPNQLLVGSASFWLRSDDNGSNGGTSLVATFSNNTNFEVDLKFKNKSFAELRILAAGSSVFPIMNTSVVDFIDEWHFIVITLAPTGGGTSNLSLYMDGILQNKTSSTMEVGNTNNFLFANPVGAKTGGNLYMDRFRIWNRTLTPEEANNTARGIKDIDLRIGNENKTIPDTILVNLNRTSKIINLNATIFNNIIDDNCNCDNCTIDGATCEIDLTLFSTNTKNISISKLNLTYEWGVDFCNEFTSEALNVSIKESVTGIPIDVNVNHFNEFWVDPLNVQNSSTSLSGINNYSLCIFPNSTTIQSDMLIQYVNGSTTYEHSIYNKTLDNETDFLDLFVTGGTSQVIFTVKDTNGDPVPGAIIKVLLFNVGNGSYNVVEALETDGNGQTVGNIVLIDAFYRFIIEFEGIVRLIEPETGGVRVLSTTKNFILNLEGDDWLDSYEESTGVFTTLIFNNLTHSFTYTWVDSNSNVISGCLRVTKTNRSGSFGVNDTCINAVSSSIVQGVGTIPSGTGFTATGYLEFNPDHITDVLSEVNTTATQKFFNVGDKGDSSFMSFLLILTLALIGIPLPAVSLVLMGVGIIGSFLLGFTQIGSGLVVAMILLIMLHLFKMRGQ